MVLKSFNFFKTKLITSNYKILKTLRKLTKKVIDKFIINLLQNKFKKSLIEIYEIVF